MGMFSWHAQDDGEPIYSAPGHHRPVYMTDDEGHEWCEDTYEGYGVFGSKDFYVLLAEMNRELLAGPIAEGYYEARDQGISLAFGARPYRSPNLNHTSGCEYTWKAPDEHADQGWFYAD